MNEAFHFVLALMCGPHDFSWSCINFRHKQGILREIKLLFSPSGREKLTFNENGCNVSPDFSLPHEMKNNSNAILTQ